MNPRTPDAKALSVQACRPEDREMLATPAGQALIRAVITQLRWDEILSALNAYEAAWLEKGPQAIQEARAALEDTILAVIKQPEKSMSDNSKSDQSTLFHIARKHALAFPEHSYLPKTQDEADRFIPHRWVMEAMREAMEYGRRTP